MINKGDFFKIIEFLQDETKTSGIPSEIRQLALNSKIRTQTFFENVIDSVAFTSDDYNRLRKMIVDWYASLKTFQDLAP